MPLYGTYLLVKAWESDVKTNFGYESKLKTLFLYVRGEWPTGLGHDN